MKTGLWIRGGLSALVVFLGSSALVLATHTSNQQVDVCCAWNSALNDGDLTYSISGGSGDDQDAVQRAVVAWDTAVGPLALTKVFDKSANIKIKLSRGGGVIAGSAKRSFERYFEEGVFTGWLIKSVDLTISLKAFGLDNSDGILEAVTRHEMGHALGLGHANFDDLMYPTMGGVDTISACDVAGVVAAQHWKLGDVGITTPHVPHVNHVGCTVPV